MNTKYLVDGKEFTSSWEVRQYLGKREENATVFGDIPREGQKEFWAKLGVEYVEIPPTAEEQAQMDLQKAKQERARAVASIKVEVDGMTFDGDESAQSRMARAITAAEASGLEKTVWVLADNTVAEVTKAQLQQALAKAMLAMGELWTVPYTGAKE